LFNYKNLSSLHLQ